MLSQSIDIDFRFSHTVSRAPNHQGERGTHHEEYPMRVVNQAVPENIMVDGSQENQ